MLRLANDETNQPSGLYENVANTLVKHAKKDNENIRITAAIQEELAWIF